VQGVKKFRVFRGTAEDVEKAVNDLLDEGWYMSWWQAVVDPNPVPGMAGDLILLAECYLPDEEDE
jgi:hypothetical protein